MSVLDEVKNDMQKERFMHVYKNYGRYFIYVIFLIFTFLICYFWWQNHQKNVILSEASEYADAISAGKLDIIQKLEVIKEGKTIYASLAQFQLAGVYAEQGLYDKAIHNYEQFIKRGGISDMYLDYAKLMLIKVKLTSGKINHKVGVKLLQDYSKNSAYFQNLARLVESVLLLNIGDSTEAGKELDLIITDYESSKVFIELAKIVKKRVNSTL